MTNIETLGKGALIKEPSLRDYRLEHVAGAGVLPTKFSLRDKVGRVKTQGSSSACVAFATAYYVQLLNFLETQTQTEMSSRDIYSTIFQPQGGSYIKDAMQKVLNTGVVPETEASSDITKELNPEAYMRNRSDITPSEVEDGKTYLARSYVTFDTRNIDTLKQAIVQGNGCIVATQGNNVLFANADILLPDVQNQFNWQHGILLTGYDDTTRKFEFINSWNGWGDQGYGYLPYEYATNGYLSNAYTLIDIPNLTYTKLMSIISNLKALIAKILLTKKQ